MRKLKVMNPHIIWNKSEPLMKWEVKKVEKGWGVFLIKKYCKTDEPVCYGVSTTKISAEHMAERLNNPLYKEKV
jgi:hypothetical protein